MLAGGGECKRMLDKAGARPKILARIFPKERIKEEEVGSTE